jgi:hypothetical protein
LIIEREFREIKTVSRRQLSDFRDLSEKSARKVVFDKDSAVRNDFSALLHVPEHPAFGFVGVTEEDTSLSAWREMGSSLILLEMNISETSPQT